MLACKQKPGYLVHLLSLGFTEDIGLHPKYKTPCQVTWIVHIRLAWKCDGARWQQEILIFEQKQL